MKLFTDYLTTTTRQGSLTVHLRDISLLSDRSALLKAPLTWSKAERLDACACRTWFKEKRLAPCNMTDALNSPRSIIKKCRSTMACLLQCGAPILPSAWLKIFIYHVRISLEMSAHKLRHAPVFFCGNLQLSSKTSSDLVLFIT